MIEDTEIATRFARLKFGADKFVLQNNPENEIFAHAVAATLDGIDRSGEPITKMMTWSDIVMQRTEEWPIQFLLPGGAYVH
jgi:uncharacterized lipoprotein NlpE involved in copper resistance